jgi:hypothetical protein
LATWYMAKSLLKQLQQQWMLGSSSETQSGLLVSLLWHTALHSWLPIQCSQSKKSQELISLLPPYATLLNTR